MTCPGKISEDDIVKMLARRFNRKTASLEAGIGDDAAVILPRGAKERWVVTTDMVVEGVDFRSGWQTPAELGWKALAVNLSDLAAMGAQPRFFTVSLAIAPDTPQKWIEHFYDGIEQVSTPHGAILIGGDLSRSQRGIQISITVLGESRNRKILYRSGGRPEDIVYVTGVLGKAAAGLALLFRTRKQGKTAAERDALKAFRTPQPRCEAGKWLARSGLVHAMMDLSDGISTDLPRLCQASGSGAEVIISNLPCFLPSTAWGLNPVDLALNGGEDFELLFCVPPDKSARLEKMYPRKLPPITRIGRLTARRAVVYRDHPGASERPLPPCGFDHFRG